MRKNHSVARTGDAGFALISVLALVSLAALTTTAFLATARLERMSSRTTGDQTRLEMALDSGLEFASYPITLGGDTWNVPNALVGEDANGIGYLFQGRPSTTPGSTTVRYYPLFSPATISNISTNMLPSNSMVFTSTSQADFVGQKTNTNGLPRFTNFSGSARTVQIPLLGARMSPPVGWITNMNLVGGVSTPAFRFAYFTEDKEGLIDADSMGGAVDRSTGTNPAEISLIPVGIPTNKYGDFLSFRSIFVSPGMIKEVFTNKLGVAATNAQYFSAGNRSVNGFLAPSTDSRGLCRVPEGLGYPNSGSTAMNLNTRLNSANVTELANWINANLPGFTNRAGGFPVRDYTLTLAANIIDYADADSLPTTASSPSGGPPIRGYDSYPLPTTYYDRFAYTAINGNRFTITVTPYVQVWNPSSANTGPITLTLTNNITEFVQGFSQSISFPNQPYVNQVTLLPMAPNEVRVVSFPMATYTLDYGAPPPTTLPVNGMNGGSVFTGSNSFSIGGVTIAQTRSPMERKGRNFKFPATGNNIDWAGVLPSLRYKKGATSTTEINPYPLGDPRMTLYLVGAAAAASDYSARGCWWGIAEATGITKADPPLWPDGGFNSGSVVRTTSDAQTPLDVGNRSLTKSEEAPAKISNAGPWSTNTGQTTGAFSNICVLGRIFDPIQWFWAEQGSATATLDRISIPSTATANSIYGGGNTLRIGKFEHAKFAFTNQGGQLVPNMQQSAAALLDIFCVQDRCLEAGKININTAPPAVLRALASEVVVGNMNTPTLPRRLMTNPPALVEAFVRGVTNFRARHPFYSPSQLSFIGDDSRWPTNWPTNAVFGNTYGTVGTAQGISQANDEVMEEWFSKIYNLTKVGTFNYRVYVVAQMLTTNGVPKGPMLRRYYEVHNRRNNDINPASCSLVITRRADY